ncbi:MAG TPA: class I SAM-dependent methyltransferase [Candidatus Tenderia electrophaga]|uniref:Class I SAM-dependent methyltransferase n=1 Tax=Candidatus Tenderia electrophaga TaxID=1748243 RepID=A0A832N591_9GAMM|nr:class I SAM-dependent methyltransferase [Candidatus Tenderia electrophaga]
MEQAFWQARYSQQGAAYGVEPNAFLRRQAGGLRPGSKVLVVGDGEGRNGVWLARQGMQVTTVDYAQAGIDRALALASESRVNINAVCADLSDWPWPQAEFDVVVSIYLHFPSTLRTQMHQCMLAALKPGGQVILEAFNKAQLDYPSGGPPLADALFSADLLAQDFASADIALCQESVVELDEGKYHVGPAAVVRLLARRLD